MRVRLTSLRRRFDLPANADRAEITAALAAPARPNAPSHAEFMAARFPGVAAKLTARRSVRGALPHGGEGYAQTWPGTVTPKQRPASLDRPPAPAQPDLFGPAVPPPIPPAPVDTSPATETQVGQDPGLAPPVSDWERHQRRIGGQVRPDRPRADLTARPPGSTIEKSFTWT
jgi:hypothetical protein